VDIDSLVGIGLMVDIILVVGIGLEQHILGASDSLVGIVVEQHTLEVALSSQVGTIEEQRTLEVVLDILVGIIKVRHSLLVAFDILVILDIMGGVVGQIQASIIDTLVVTYPSSSMVIAFPSFVVVKILRERILFQY